jgi:glyceraldehyde-3-phosphate dehydrogenase/erythrose-4-phosphate dehydrogenase
MVRGLLRNYIKGRGNLRGELFSSINRKRLRIDIECTFVCVMSWYDNEWRSSNRMDDTAVAMAKLGETPWA